MANLEPWKPHARRLHAAGRSVRDVCRALEEFYGIPFSFGKVQRFLARGRESVSAYSSVSLKIQRENETSNSHGHDEVTGAARDHRDDDAERWLSRNDPAYAETRRQWQQCRTDAIARQSGSGLQAVASDADE